MFPDADLSVPELAGTASTTFSGQFHFWVFAIKSSSPFTIAVSAQPGFSFDPSTGNVFAPKAVSLEI
jgi:hypothetical protein